MVRLHDSSDNLSGDDETEMNAFITLYTSLLLPPLPYEWEAEQPGEHAQPIEESGSHRQAPR